MASRNLLPYMGYEFITQATAQGVATLTLNRPDVLNSFNRPMARELQAGFAEAARDDSVRAILVTGAGRAFCAGQDLGEAVGAHVDLADIVKGSYTPLVRAIREIGKPVVAAVNG